MFADEKNHTLQTAQRSGRRRSQRFTSIPNKDAAENHENLEWLADQENIYQQTSINFPEGNTTKIKNAYITNQHSLRHNSKIALSKPSGIN